MRLIKDYDRDANKNSDFDDVNVDFDVDDAADVDVDLHAGDIVVVETRLQFEDGSRRKRDHVWLCDDNDDSGGGDNDKW